MSTVTAANPLATNATIDLDSIRIDPVWALRVPSAFAIRKRLLPLCKLDETVVVAATQPIDAPVDKALRAYLKTDYRLVMAEPEALRQALTRVYDTLSLDGRMDAASPQAARPVASGSSDDAVGWCDELLQAATLRGASDIHLVPGEKVLRIHLRVDGVLELYRELPMVQHSSIVSRLKVLAGLDIAEKRAAQDGRITSQMKSSKRKMDIRVATLPTRYGERLTLRLLTPQDAQLSLASLGMRFADLEKFRRATARPHGLILLTGPTGSGKSTTLYVAIEQLLETHGGNVITIEDPVEYEIRGASQVEVDSADKVNFSKALRSVLRHDPDVVMIGEIRDAETASIAVKASLTGHLVFSTLHTNTATGVVTRLLDLGIEPFLIAATLRLSVAQRLVRRLCPHCRRERPMLETEALSLRQPKLTGHPVYEPVGCIACAGRGYTGRIGLFEILESSESFANLISSGATEDALNDHLRQRGESLLLDDGLEKILDGRTTVKEVVSAVTTW